MYYICNCPIGDELNKLKCTMDYLKIPLDLSVALKGTLARCSPEESIAQNIMLLIVSHPGEIFGKYEYGSMSCTMTTWAISAVAILKVGCSCAGSTTTGDVLLWSRARPHAPFNTSTTSLTACGVSTVPTGTL